MLYGVSSKAVWRLFIYLKVSVGQAQSNLSVCVAVIDKHFLLMFSETIYISHSANGSGSGGGKGVRNGHGRPQNANGRGEVLFKESSGSNSEMTGGDNVRSFYKSRITEKLYSDGARATREESREVSCFVRSEIKWVFLKSLKVLNWCREAYKEITPKTTLLETCLSRS